jgi:hypothetical protein
MSPEEKEIEEANSTFIFNRISALLMPEVGKRLINVEMAKDKGKITVEIKISSFTHIP